MIFLRGRLIRVCWKSQKTFLKMHSIWQGANFWSLIRPFQGWILLHLNLELHPWLNNHGLISGKLTLNDWNFKGPKGWNSITRGVVQVTNANKPGPKGWNKKVIPPWHFQRFNGNNESLIYFALSGLRNYFDWTRGYHPGLMIVPFQGKNLNAFFEISGYEITK